MRHFPKVAILLVVIFIVVATVFTYLFQSYRFNEINKTMKEATKVAIAQSLDHSTRVSEGKVTITKEQFESLFKDEFKKVNINMNVKQYKFDYLETEDAHLKAVKVGIVDDEDTHYQVTFASDISD